MESFRLPDLPLRTRIAAWTAQYCAQFGRDEFFAADLAKFEASLHVGTLGPLRFARLDCGGSAVDRSHAARPDPSSDSYTVIVQQAGSGMLQQYGRQAALQPGDLALCDDAAPHTHTMGRRSELILVRIPARELRAHLPSPEHFCGRRLAAAEGMTPTAVSLIASLCRRSAADVPPAMQECLARQALELVAISFSLGGGPQVALSPALGGRYAQARLFIERNLRDPELGPGAIAQSLRVSSRYLRMVFAGANESVSSYILRRRLEETARQLADPRWRGRSICEIAFGWGFNSAPHYSRSFRGQYGMSPRQYRLRHLSPAPAG